MTIKKPETIARIVRGIRKLLGPAETLSSITIEGVEYDAVTCLPCPEVRAMTQDELYDAQGAAPAEVSVRKRHLSLVPGGES
jgi:hypothetical protein